MKVSSSNWIRVPNDATVDLSATTRNVSGFDMSLSIGIIVTGEGNLSASASATYDDGSISETKQLGGDEQEGKMAFTINNRDFTKADKIN